VQLALDDFSLVEELMRSLPTRLSHPRCTLSIQKKSENRLSKPVRRIRWH
jgi:hypothetical protein